MKHILTSPARRVLLTILTATAIYSSCVAAAIFRLDPIERFKLSCAAAEHILMSVTAGVGGALTFDLALRRKGS